MDIKETVLITGANGEVGHGLIPALSENKKVDIIALDINELDAALKPSVSQTVKGSVLSKSLLHALISKNKVTTIFHLAALLSAASEANPEKAQFVNVSGTATVLEITNHVARREGRVIKIVFPSTIAVYGLPDLMTKKKAPAISEEEYNTPTTIYGINKLYCEMLGNYYSKNYKMLTEKNLRTFIDFRCLRFPGIISAITVPAGGTSDFAPEMIHTAAQGQNYESFVSADTQIPFVVMPDAVKALIAITGAPREKLKKSVYNVSGFSAKAKEIENLVTKVFPNTAVSYNPDESRQKIVDTWPAAIDDSAARTDWGWKPDYDLERAFSEYLIPEIQNRYK